MTEAYINDIRVAPNFKLREFACRDGSHQVVLHSHLLERLQLLRNLAQRPVIITSAYRNEEHNRAVGGSPNSYHLKGMAADITVRGMTPAQVAALAQQVGFRGIIAYSNHLHVDVGPRDYMRIPGP